MTEGICREGEQGHPPRSGEAPLSPGGPTAGHTRAHLGRPRPPHAHPPGGALPQPPGSPGCFIPWICLDVVEFFWSLWPPQKKTLRKPRPLDAAPPPGWGLRRFLRPCTGLGSERHGVGRHGPFSGTGGKSGCHCRNGAASQGHLQACRKLAGTAAGLRLHVLFVCLFLMLSTTTFCSQ